MHDRGGRQIRCAIYTRKSTEEGLEQDFNSLHAQRESCESFIASQRHEGWKALGMAFDDGGFSGGSMSRPALQGLLQEVRAGRIDTVVVYKVDRLTRSLADFAKIIEMFDAHKVSFVSVTQQFNTTTSMGRLTLNILLSFAQFERELTGERVRDKIAASKKKGLWMGGYVPLGYRAHERTLAIDENEAEIVRTIFALYLEYGSVSAVHADLLRRQVMRPISVTESGRQYGGRPFSRGLLYAMLANPIYSGDVAHKGQHYVGQHRAIVDSEMWAAVQARLAANKHAGNGGPQIRSPSLLTGILYDDKGNRFTPTHANKHGKRYRYYALPSPNGAPGSDGETKPLPLRRIAAAEIESAVLEQIQHLLKDKQLFIAVLDAAKAAPHEVSTILYNAENMAVNLKLMPSADQTRILRTVIGMVVVTETDLQLKVSPAAIAELLSGSAKAGPSWNPRGSELPISKVLGARKWSMESNSVFETLSVPITFKRRGVETKLIVCGPSDRTNTGQIDSALIKAVARAHTWFEDLATGRAKNCSDVAARERMTVSSVSRLLPLAFLAPRVIEAILVGEQSPETSAQALIRREDIPSDWQDQFAALVR